MLQTLLVVLLILWLLGVVTTYTFGGIIHGLLLNAPRMVPSPVLRGQTPLPPLRQLLRRETLVEGEHGVDEGD